MTDKSEVNFIAIDFETATSKRASITLDYLCEQLGIEQGTHHRAGDDVEMCARLYLRELEVNNEDL